jgi:hypothetical protein
MRYTLQNPVRSDGLFLTEVVLRTPTKKDQRAVLDAAAELARERGREPTTSQKFALMIAQLADLPRSAITKLAVRDAQILAGHAVRLFAERGMP